MLFGNLLHDFEVTRSDMDLAPVHSGPGMLVDRHAEHARAESETESEVVFRSGSFFLDARAGLGPAIDDGLLDVGRDGLVGPELHGERALAAGHALEVGGVAEDLAQGDGGLDRPGCRREAPPCR